MPENAYVPFLNLTRGDIVESVHFGCFVITDSYGRVLASAGDPNLVTYPRSSMKPLQVLSFLENGGAEAFQLIPEEVAIMCASHSGTDVQAALIQRMQKKIGISLENLQCGVHWPIDKETTQAMHDRGEELNALRHNCSGKHTGMLAYAQLLGEDLTTYLENSHPVQKAILNIVAEMCDLDPQSIPIAKDGCSAPVFGLPMRNFAMAIARLWDTSGLSAQRAEACARVTCAMSSQPGMVAGPGRFDTVLMTATQGRLIAKSGAEGYITVGIKSGALFQDSPALGIALKISDGDYRKRAIDFVTIQILSALGIVGESELAQLNAFADPHIYNWRKIIVGEMLPTFMPLEIIW